VSGDVILLTDGTYIGDGNRTVEFFGGKNLVVRSESGNRSACIIDLQGSTGHTGFFITSGQTAASRIEGITIRNGGWGTGGAISVSGASPAITNCVFENNHNDSNGGAVSLAQSSSSVTDCLFLNNSAANVGGALWISNPPAPIVISGNVFEGNQAAAGGAVHAASNFQIALQNNTFRGNAATGDWGSSASALSLSEVTTGANPVVTGNVFFDNSCATSEWTVYASGVSPTITNNTFANNDGTALGLEFDANATVQRNIFVGSSDRAIRCLGFNPHLSVPMLSCNLIWNNAGGNSICGQDQGGNFAADPLFCDLENGNLTLSSNSPCLPGNHPNQCGSVGALGAGCGVSGVAEAGLGERPRVMQNIPNPFGSSTTIEFVLPKPVEVSLRIYDVAGRLVRTVLLNDSRSSGEHRTTWDGQDELGRPVTPGVYLYRLTAGDISETRRMTIVR
jgi:hypothetical protein